MKRILHLSIIVSVCRRSENGSLMIWFFERSSVTIETKRSVPNVNVISSIAGRKNADDVSVNVKPCQQRICRKMAS